MNRTTRTADELVQIYAYAEQGKDPKEIADLLDINYYSVLAALTHLTRYLAGKAGSQLRRSKNYSLAVTRIRTQPAANQPSSSAPSHDDRPTTDHFAFLKRSFDIFQQSIAAFIEEELGRRHQALQDEVEALREENKQLTQKLESGQTINWIDTLENNLAKENA